MIRKSHLRRLFLESLESRHLLAGVISAELVGGDLVLTGDREGNGLTIQPLPDGPTGLEPAAIVLQPDRSTRINDGQPGVRVVFHGVTGGILGDFGAGADQVTIVHRDVAARNLPVQLNTGSGEDSVVVRGLRASGLSVVNPEDPDQVTIVDSELGNVHIDNSPGGSTLVRNSSVKELDKSSPILANSLSVSGGDIRLRDVKVEVPTRLTQAGTVVIRDSTFKPTTAKPVPANVSVSLDAARARLFKVEIEGATNVQTSGDLRMSEVSVTKWIDKSTPDLLLTASSGNTTMSDLRVEGPTRISSDGNLSISSSSFTRPIDKATPALMLHCAAAKATLNKVEIEGATSVQTSGDLRMSEVSVTKWIDKSSPILMLAEAGGNATLNELRVEGPTQVAAGSKLVIKSSSFTQPIDKATPKLMLSADAASALLSELSIEGTTRVTTSGDLSMSDLSIVRSVDKATPQLLLHIDGGKSTRLKNVRVDGDVQYIQINLKEAIVSSYSVSGSDVRGKMSVEADGNMSVKVDDTRVSENVVLNFAKIKVKYIEQASRGQNFQFIKTSIGGDLHIKQSTGITRGTLRDTSVGGETTIDLSGREPSSDSNEPADVRGGTNRVSLRSSNFERGVRLVSGGPTNVVVSEVKSSGPMDIEVKMKVPAPPAPFVPVPYPNASTVSLVDSQIGGNFTVDSFFDIVYQIDGQSTFSNVGGSSMDVSARGSSIGGDFAVDSFFDITYQLSPGPAGEPVAVASPEVDVRCSELKIGGDFVVDSFFDIEYRIEFQGKPGSSSLEADGSAANVSVRESDIAGDVLLDTSLQVLSNNPLHAESSVGGSSALFQGTNVGGDFNVDSFFDITVTDVDPRPGQDTPLSPVNTVRISDSTVKGSLNAACAVNDPPESPDPRDGQQGLALNRVRITGSQLGGLRILSQGHMLDDVLIRNTHVAGRTVIQLGTADDRLRIIDSVFAGPSVLDGGSQFDTLTLKGNRFAFEPELIDWDVVNRDDDNSPLDPTV